MRQAPGFYSKRAVVQYSNRSNKATFTLSIFLEQSEEILYFNLLVTVLVYSATIPCFHMFATLQ